MNNINNLNELRAIASESNKLIDSITVYSDLKSIEVLKSMLSKRILDEVGIRVDTDTTFKFEQMWRYKGMVQPIQIQRLVYLCEVSFNDGTTTTYLDRYDK